jgi:iron complex outermembrane receptor protein
MWEYLKPTISEQYEAGVKYDLNGILLTGSVYRIDKANFFDEFHDDNTRTRSQDGRQIHKGVEFEAMGKLTPRLTLWGGATWLDATVVKTNNPAQRGHTPANLPQFLAKMYAEYELPWLPRLYLTGAVYHTGKQSYQDTTTDKLKAFTVGDVGTRYETRIGNVDTVFRLNVANVTNEKYWRRVNWAGMGDPRTITFSVSTRF